jgi:hypothetical protein
MEKSGHHQLLSHAGCNAADVTEKPRRSAHEYLSVVYDGGAIAELPHSFAAGPLGWRYVLLWLHENVSEKRAKDYALNARRVQGHKPTQRGEFPNHGTVNLQPE